MSPDQLDVEMIANDRAGFGSAGQPGGRTGDTGSTSGVLRDGVTRRRHRPSRFCRHRRQSARSRILDELLDRPRVRRPRHDGARVRAGRSLRSDGSAVRIGPGSPRARSRPGSTLHFESKAWSVVHHTRGRRPACVRIDSEREEPGNQQHGYEQDAQCERHANTDEVDQRVATGLDDQSVDRR